MNGSEINYGYAGLYILLFLVIIFIILIFIRLSKHSSRIKGLEETTINDDGVIFIIRRFFSNLVDYTPSEEERVQIYLEEGTQFEEETSKHIFDKIIIKTQQDFKQRARIIPGTQQINPKDIQ